MTPTVLHCLLCYLRQSCRKSHRGLQSFTEVLGHCRDRRSGLEHSDNCSLLVDRQPLSFARRSCFTGWGTGSFHDCEWHDAMWATTYTLHLCQAYHLTSPVCLLQPNQVEEEYSGACHCTSFKKLMWPSELDISVCEPIVMWSYTNGHCGSRWTRFLNTLPEHAAFNGKTCSCQDTYYV